MAIAGCADTAPDLFTFGVLRYWVAAIGRFR